MARRCRRGFATAVVKGKAYLSSSWACFESLTFTIPVFILPIHVLRAFDMLSQGMQNFLIARDASMGGLTFAVEGIRSRLRRRVQSIVPYFWHLVHSQVLYSLLPMTVADRIIANTLKPAEDAKEVSISSTSWIGDSQKVA